MPRKGKRSESQKQRRKLQSSLGTSNNTNSVSGMSDENPYVLSVKASHCQTDARYSMYSRGRQCTCNSLMFLAVHTERNKLQSFDLDRILQKGDAVYTSVKRALQSKGKFVGNFLNFDELPNTIETHSRCYNILKHPQRFGFLRDTPALGNYENLENTLQCLRADVSDALLLCAGSCIAVFRDRSGRFGYFDSHCRSIYGMPADEGTGTAVFLTFHQLPDLVDRLLLLFQGLFDLRDQEEFELLPVSFTSMITESCVRTEVSLNCCDLEHDVQPSISFENKALSNDEQCSSADVPQQYVQVQESVQQLSETAVNRATSTDEQAPLTEVSLNCCDLEHDVQPSVSFENKALSNNEQCSSADVSQQYVQVQDPVHQLPETDNRATSTNKQGHLTDQHKIKYVTSVTQDGDRYKNVSFSNIFHDVLSQSSSTQRALLAPIHHYSKSTDLTKQLKKLNKTQRRKAYCTKWHKEKVCNKNQAKTKIYNYKIHKEMNKQAMKNKYWHNAIYRGNHKQAMKINYKNNREYRERKKSNVTSNYKNNEQLRQRQRDYIIRNYRNDEQFRERQKSYIMRNYRNNAKYKEQHMQYLVDRYSRDPIFRKRQKDHYTNRCKNDSNFYEQRKKIFKQRYQSDAHFRARHKEYYLFKSKNKISAFKILHKVHCAQDIKYKYKKNYLMHQQRGTLQDSQPDIVQDPGMLRALNIFRDVIKKGPTYVCTCCARALFLNQVRKCEVCNYQKNPTVAALCLTGNYVHICSDCPDRCALEDMKTEWICHSCHTTLLRGLMPDIAVANMLQFTPIPPELCDLNILERHVIAKYIPFAKIVTLPKGQQRAIKGAVISVASEVETTVNCLPRPRSDSQLLTVKLKRRLCYQGHYQFQTLNMHKVLSALRKLKVIHSEYKDIIINAAFSEEEMFNEHEQSTNDISAPDEEMDIESSSLNENTEEQSNENEHNDSSDDPENTAEEQSRGLALDTCLQPPDLGQQLLSYDDGIFCIAPAAKNSPVSIFKVKNLESMSFPVQFPDGKNTFDEPDRAKHVSPQ